MYKIVSVLVAVVSFMSPVMGSTATAPTHPYLLLAGNAAVILQDHGYDQGENVENDCFDMETLFVTKEERDRKFSGHSDFKFKNPSKHPYQALKDSLRSRDIISPLRVIQGLEDQLLFSEASKNTKRQYLSHSYEGISLPAHKKDLYTRFCTIRERLLETGGVEGMKIAMQDCIRILKEIHTFANDGCVVYNLLSQKF